MAFKWESFRTLIANLIVVLTKTSLIYCGNTGIAFKYIVKTIQGHCLNGPNISVKVMLFSLDPPS